MLFTSSATFVGAVAGVCTQMYACALRKVPLFHQPQIHAGFAVAGAFTAEWLVQKEQSLQKEVDALVRDRQERNKDFDGFKHK